MEYIVVIGLEIHVELSTNTKMFCSCTSEYGGGENTHCCPSCIGMPGTLPVINRKAVEYAVKAGVAMNCTIADFCRMDRKNYFYPDLPKAYQISQNEFPLCVNGYVNIELDGEEKRIGITRIHIEEDAGKLIHDDAGMCSLIDFNRSGVPLIEIVSEPDLRSADEAKSFIENVRTILQYIGVSDCKMQEGAFRVDVNLSVMPSEGLEFGTRTEMKNLNSIRAISRAIENEAKRQINELKNGRAVVQETRRWDDAKGQSYSMRSKEDSHDYRFFPEPDLMPIVVGDEWLEEIRRSLPELPEARKKRYILEYELPEYDAWVLTREKSLSDFFESAALCSSNVKAISNWIMGDIIRILKEKKLEAREIPFPAEYLSRLIKLIDAGKVSTAAAKIVLLEMFQHPKEPEQIIKEQGLAVLKDNDFLRQVVKNVIINNPKSVEDYLGGKRKALSYLMGQAMKETKGKADPQLINRLLEEEISK